MTFAERVRGWKGSRNVRDASLYSTVTLLLPDIIHTVGNYCAIQGGHFPSLGKYPFRNRNDGTSRWVTR